MNPLRRIGSVLLICLIYIFSPVFDFVEWVMWVKYGEDNDGWTHRYNRFTGKMYRRTGFTTMMEPTWMPTGYKHDKFNKTYQKRYPNEIKKIREKAAGT